MVATILSFAVLTIFCLSGISISNLENEKNDEIYKIN